MVLMTGSSSGRAEECVGKLKVQHGAIGDIIECLKKMDAENATLKQELLAAKLPSSAIVAFDSTDLDEDHCPSGWTPFLLARARVLVGGGDPSKSPEKMAYDEQGRKLQGYVLRQHGGEQIHKLTADELPVYSPVIIKENGTVFNTHESSAVPCLDSGCNNLGVLSEPRPGQASVALHFNGFGKEDKHHNIMPPFLSVYYCKKN
jgi:hypothetical protein